MTSFYDFQTFIIKVTRPGDDGAGWPYIHQLFWRGDLRLEARIFTEVARRFLLEAIVAEGATLRAGTWETLPKLTPGQAEVTLFKELTGTRALEVWGCVEDLDADDAPGEPQKWEPVSLWLDEEDEAPTAPPRGRPVAFQLTPEQRDIARKGLSMIEQGTSRTRAAEQLHTTTKTLKKYIDWLKLEAGSR